LYALFAVRRTITNGKIEGHVPEAKNRQQRKLTDSYALTWNFRFGPTGISATINLPVSPGYEWISSRASSSVRVAGGNARPVRGRSEGRFISEAAL